jgi:hypothetical protein
MMMQMVGAFAEFEGQCSKGGPSDLAHLSPLGWEHINVTGDYHRKTSQPLGPD